MADSSDPFVTTVTLADSSQAQQVKVSPGVSIEAVVSALKLPRPSTVVVLAGSADAIEPKSEKRVLDLLSGGVARAAVDVQPAVILDCGRAGRVADLMGRGVAARGRKSRLVGVLPVPAAGDVGKPETSYLASGHTDFVLVESDDPAKVTAWILALADFLSTSPTESTSTSPVVGILAGGHGVDEPTTLDEVLAIVRRGWPLFVLEGTGHLADQIAKLEVQRRRKARRRARGLWSMLGLPGLNRLTQFKAPTPELQGIVEDGRLTVLPKEDDGSKLRTKLIRLLAKPKPEDVLLLAWRRFSEYDLNSGRKQKRFYQLKNWPLVLGVISIAVALVYSALPSDDPAKGIIRPFMIALPIAVSLFLALETRFKAGSKYILLREAAEAVKRGIYSYRVLSALPSAPDSAGTNPPVGGAPPGPGEERLPTTEPQSTPDSAGTNSPAGGAIPESGDQRLPATDDALAQYLARIGRRLMRSDVKESAFFPYSGPVPPHMYAASAIDDGVSSLTGDEYVKIRIGDQIQFYSRRTNQMERRSRWLQVAILVFGAVGAFLAAMDLQYWLPITAALVTALTAFVEYRQFEQILIKYNFAKSTLEDLYAWWRSLSDEERTAGTAKADANIRRLVRETEAVLESENSGWVQYLKEAMTQKPTATPGADDGSVLPSPNRPK